VHSGGIADKVGNRYEARWTTGQALGLLDGSLLSITVEKIGEDSFEFRLMRSGGEEWHQCKRQTSAGRWSIAALGSEGVLGAFAGKLAGGTGRCVFVSRDPASELGLLQDKLPAARGLDAFEASLSAAEARHWSTLCDRLDMERGDALDFLGQTAFKTLGEPELVESNRAQLARWFSGDPDTIAAQLRAWLEDDHNFNRPLTRDDLLAFVQDRRIVIKHYELDRALPGRIRDQTIGYRDTYPALGAGQFSIARPAAGDVLGALAEGAPVVLLTGGAGIGKSAVLGEVISGLDDAGILHLAFRVDQAAVPASLDDLGRQLVGTADNPAIILEQLAGAGRAVLIVDQADAVSEVSGRTGALRRVILDLVRKAALYPRLQIVFSCRSFDLENDHAFRALAAAPRNVRIDLAPFPREDVEQELARLGILYDPGNVRLMTLLCLPIGLTLAAELSQTGSADLRTVEHLSELYERLLLERDRELQRDVAPGWSIFAPLTALAGEMSERQALAASRAALDAFPRAIDLLERAGLIVVRGQRVSFMHESLFDFLHARTFVQRREDLVAFLLASEQTLFRRTQTRQILAFERDLDRPRYLADLEAIVTDQRVRPHIRETIILWLATVPDPEPGEWELVARYAACDGLPRKAGSVIYRRKGWFDLLVAEGVVSNWLKSGGDDLRWVLNFLLSLAPVAAAEVRVLLDSLMEQRPDGPGHVLHAMRWIDPHARASELADCLITAIERTPPDLEPGDDWSTHFGSWVKHAPRDAARILRAKLDRWYRDNPADHPFAYTVLHEGSMLHWLKELADADPLAFLEAVLPAMKTAIVRHLEDDGPPARDTLWYARRFDQKDAHSAEFIDLVGDALARVGVDNPEAAARLLSPLEPARYLTGLHLLLETVAANPAALHPLLVEQIGNPGLFRAGWNCAAAYSAGKAISASMPWLNPAERLCCEQVVLAIRPELEAAKRSLADARAGTGWFNHADFARHCLRNSGLSEWSVLRQIGSAQLSPVAAKRLAELDRKFVGRRPEQPDGMRSGWITSPIATERTQRMSDAAWLSAIDKYSNLPADRWDMDGLRGGPRELAGELKARAKDEPARFVELLAHFPDHARADFVWGIVGGVIETKPSAATVERILELVESRPASRPDDRSLAWLLRSCAEAPGPRAHAAIVAIALGEHDDGIGEVKHGRKEEKEPDWKLAFNFGTDLITRAINSSRGSALEHIGDLTWASQEMFERYRPVVDAVVGSSAPPHVHAGLYVVLLAGLKHCSRKGVDWVRRTIAACPQALLNDRGRRALHWACSLDASLVDDIACVYLGSTDALLRGFGVLIVCQLSLDHEGLVPLTEQLIAESAENRSAAAAVAAANFQAERFGGRCSEWLVRFFDDEAPMVRKEAGDCFRRLKTDNISRYRQLFEAFAASSYFETTQSSFLYRLEQAAEGADDLLLDLVEQTMRASKRADRSAVRYDLHEISALVLRIYTTNFDDPERRRRSLDLIDQLVECGVMETAKLDAV